MNSRRRLGKTEIEVSPLSLGCASLMSRIGKRESVRILEAALENGINCFDTAPTYGFGGSEIILGKTLKKHRSDIVLCSKVGQSISPWIRRLHPVKEIIRPLLGPFRGVRKAVGNAVSARTSTNAYTPQEIRTSVEQSLRRLRTDYLDVLLLHSPSLETMRQDSVFETLNALKKAGSLRAFGIAVNNWEEAALAVDCASRGVEVLQVPLHPLLTEDFLPVLFKAEAKGLGLIAREPFAGGRSFAKSYSAAQCLQWSIEKPAVASVLAGITNPAHITEGVQALSHAPKAVRK